MAAKVSRGLGKGLDSLIPMGSSSEKKVENNKEETKDSKATETTVKITQVEPNREQPRKNFDEDALQELADSIKQFDTFAAIHYTPFLLITSSASNIYASAPADFGSYRLIGLP